MPNTTYSSVKIEELKVDTYLVLLVSDHSNITNLFDKVDQALYL